KDIPSFLVGAHQILDGDLNGDGYVDLVLLSTDATYMMLNNGRGTFEEEAFNTMGLPHGATTRAALFDADLDGDLDLFLIQPGIDRMNAELYRNDGSGRMTEVTNLDDRFPSATDLPRSIAVSDADRDGDLDLLIAFYDESTGSRIDLLRNDGNTFVRREILRRADAHVNRIAMIDINADGADDLVVLNGDAVSEVRTNLLCINDGRANFVDAHEADLPETIQFDFDKSQGIAFGDLDGDGALDLVVANAGQNRIYLNEAPTR
ncbi:MAG: VCBS repeat-containing protein, partial [Deltaproteobacteria bacterium]